MKFERYQHIERLDNSDINGLLDGRVYVYPKIDGSNASIWLDDDGNLSCGSRNRVVTPEETNQGFYDYVVREDNKAKLLGYFAKFPTHRLYGEWLVPHTLKTYRDDAWKKLYIFDVMDGDKYLSYEEYKDGLEEFGIEFLDPLVIMNSPTEEMVASYLDKNTVLIKDGEGVGEGVVIKNYNFTNRYGVCKWGKIVRNDFKEKNRRIFGINELSEPFVIEADIVEKTITKALVDKELSKIRILKGEFTNKEIPMLLGMMWHCLLSEELPDQIKKRKNPTINFKELMRLCNVAVKKHIGIA